MEPKDKLRAWMTAKNYTPVTLGRELGVTDNYIYKLLAGKKNFGNSLYVRFCQRFGTKEAAKIFNISLKAMPDRVPA